MILIEVYSLRTGEMIARCDQSCYGATWDICDCPCGGLNHAIGKQPAINNTILSHDTITTYATRKYEREHGAIEVRFPVIESGAKVQGGLWR